MAGSSQDIPSNLFSSEFEKNEFIKAMSSGPNQTEAERRQIRSEYRKLQDELAENKQDITNPSDAENLLQQKLKIVNQLFTNVQQPREGSLDSTSLVQIADLGIKKAQAFQPDFVQFNPTDFCQRVKLLINPDADQAAFSQNDWLKLGQAVQFLFDKTPVLQFMCGSFQRGEVSVKKRQQKVVTDKNTQNDSGKETKPTELSTFQTVEGGELTTKYVEHVLETLWKLYGEAEVPVDYFEFVTHPTSFGQTVENIFYTSFLIRDGYAKLSLDDDNLPVIEPIKKEETGTSEESSERQQLVIQITPAEWREIVKTFEIEEPCIRSMPTEQKVKR